jgi:integrase
LRSIDKANLKLLRKIDSLKGKAAITFREPEGQKSRVELKLQAEDVRWLRANKFVSLREVVYDSDGQGGWLSSYGEVTITPEGKSLLEERDTLKRENFWYKAYPLAISTIALLVSLLAFFYARGSEFCAFSIRDVDQDTGQALIRDGKGGKSRYVRFGIKSLRALKRYLRARGAQYWGASLITYGTPIFEDGVRYKFHYHIPTTVACESVIIDFHTYASTVKGIYIYPLTP